MKNYTNSTADATTPWYPYRTTIKKIVIEKGVTSIGNYAFGGCVAATSISIPDSVTKIGEGAFSSCTRLTSILIPDSVTSIGQDAFQFCGIREITIPGSVRRIDSRTFYCCFFLQKATISEGVQTLASGSFCHCDSLTNITLPQSLKSTGLGGSIMSCDKLRVINYNGSEADWKQNMKHFGYSDMSESTISKIKIYYNASGPTIPIDPDIGPKMPSKELNPYGSPSQEEITKAFEKYRYKELIDSTVTYAEQPVLSSADQLKAGKISQKSIQDGLDAVNLIRFVAGIPEIEEDSSFTKAAQHGSVLLAHIGMSLHEPRQPSGVADEFYKLAFQATKRSNLFEGSDSIVEAIFGYMDDADIFNVRHLGHRRKIIDIDNKKIGFGLARSLSSKKAYSVTYLTDGFYYSSVYTNNLAWPAPNMPLELFKQSFEQSMISYGKAWLICLGNDYGVPEKENIQVTLTNQNTGKSWIFNKDRGTLFVDNNNYGQNKAIIFQPGEVTYRDGEVYHVKIEGLTSWDGIPVEPLEYSVNFFYGLRESQAVPKALTSDNIRKGYEKIWVTNIPEGVTQVVLKHGGTVKEIKDVPTYGGRAMIFSDLKDGGTYQVIARNSKGDSPALSVTAPIYSHDDDDDSASDDNDTKNTSSKSGSGGITTLGTTTGKPPSSQPSVSTTPTTNQVPLDTRSVNMRRGGTYDFLVKGNNDTDNIRVTSANPAIAAVQLIDAKDIRGAKYRVTATGVGTTQICVAYQGKTSYMTVNAQAMKGSMTLDTA